MKQKKNHARNISILFIFLFLLVSCSSTTEKQSYKNVIDSPQYEWGKVKEKTITIWGDGTDLARSYNQREFKRYEKATGNKIKCVSLTKEEIDQKVPKAFSSTEEKPDILLSYGGTNIEALHPDDNLYDFTNAQWIPDLSDTALNQSIFNGKVIGLPHGEASISGMLYNKAVFKKNGLEIPTTQDEFMEACAKLKANGITPLYLPYKEITMLLYQFPMDVFLRNSETLAKLNSGEISYEDIPEMKTIVKWYKDMADLGYLGTDYEQNDWDGMDDAMKNNQYGMMIGWDTWIYTSFSGNAANIGLMPAFIGIPNEGTFEGANTTIFMVNKNSVNLDASLDFIQFLADPYNYNKAFKDIYTAPVFNNQIGSMTTPQYMEIERQVERLYNDSTAWLRVRGFSQYDALFIQRYMQGEYDIDTCLKNMEQSRRQRAGL